ncbi:MAG TPA: hypothetical protein VFG90_12280 [Nitrososphaeraceae archaeon]|nr:hypothetical protein [Nitrososphaeraceae archaeon]
MNLHRHSRLVIITILTIAYVTIAATYADSKASFADSINPGVFALDSKPYGNTFEEWTIKFWQWLLPIPTDKSPMTDTTGERCSENQNSSSPVFFLVFSGGGSAVRTCDVPAGKAILVPVNVVECSFAEMNVKTEEELHTCAEEDESSNPGLFLSVDGKQFKELETYRVHSRAFDTNFPENPIFGKPGPTRAVSDGYWVILEPLTPGKHDIHFKASLTNPTTGILFYNDDVKYTINVK